MSRTTRLQVKPADMASWPPETRVLFDMLCEAGATFEAISTHQSRRAIKKKLRDVARHEVLMISTGIGYGPGFSYASLQNDDGEGPWRDFDVYPCLHQVWTLRHRAEMSLNENLARLSGMFKEVYGEKFLERLRPEPSANAAVSKRTRHAS